jgi:hypothetical protein
VNSFLKDGSKLIRYILFLFFLLHRHSASHFVVNLEFYPISGLSQKVLSKRLDMVSDILSDAKRVINAAPRGSHQGSALVGSLDGKSACRPNMFILAFFFPHIISHHILRAPSTAYPF